MIASDPAPAGPLSPIPTKPARSRQGSDAGRTGATADFDAVLGEADAETPVDGKAAPVEDVGTGGLADMADRTRRGDLRAKSGEAGNPAVAPSAEAIAIVAPIVAAPEGAAAGGPAPAADGAPAAAGAGQADAMPVPGKAAEGRAEIVAAEAPSPALQEQEEPDLPVAGENRFASALPRAPGRSGKMAVSETPYVPVNAAREADPARAVAAEPLPKTDGPTREIAEPGPTPTTTGASTTAVSAPVIMMQPAAGPGWQLSVQPAAVADRAAPRTEAVAADGVTMQVSVAITRSGGSGPRKVELRLDPPELGRVEIHLSPTEKGGLQASVVAERAETHALLRRHADMLVRELGDAGYADVSLSFAAGGDAAASGGRSPTMSTQAGSEAFTALAGDFGDPAAAAQSSRPSATPEGGLDIRL